MLITDDGTVRQALSAVGAETARLQPVNFSGRTTYYYAAAEAIWFLKHLVTDAAICFVMVFLITSIIYKIAII